MKVNVLKHGIILTPEGPMEELYFDLVLGFGKDGCQLTRRRPKDSQQWGDVALAAAPPPPAPLPEETPEEKK